MKKLYIKMSKVGRDWYIVTYDRNGNKIEVSATYKTKKACFETFNKMLALGFVKELKD